MLLVSTTEHATLIQKKKHNPQDPATGISETPQDFLDRWPSTHALDLKQEATATLMTHEYLTPHSPVITAVRTATRLLNSALIAIDSKNPLRRRSPYSENISTLRKKEPRNARTLHWSENYIIKEIHPKLRRRREQSITSKINKPPPGPSQFATLEKPQFTSPNRGKIRN